MKTYLLRLPDKIHLQAIQQSKDEDRSVASLYRLIIQRYFQRRKYGREIDNVL